MPGVVMTLVAGGLAVGLQPRELWVAFLGIVFGIGGRARPRRVRDAPHLDDVYWITEGRLSIDTCPLLKGKLKLGLLGIVFTPLVLVGAVRLAKPHSIWARWFYPRDGRRMRRSEARAVAREARWAHRRERFYDLIGGAPHLGSKRDSKMRPR